MLHTSITKLQLNVSAMTRMLLYIIMKQQAVYTDIRKGLPTVIWITLTDVPSILFCAEN